MTKQCSACGAEKPHDDFSPRAAKCKPCLTAYQAAYRAANREKANATSAAWRAAHPGYNCATGAAYRKANPEKHRANNAAWRAANVEKVSDDRARIRLAALGVMGGACVACGTTESLEFDHIHGDGGEHRKTENAAVYILRIARTGKPDPRLQLLCHECHKDKTANESRARHAPTVGVPA